jgi:hypothetical protein
MAGAETALAGGSAFPRASPSPAWYSHDHIPPSLCPYSLVELTSRERTHGEALAFIFESSGDR